MNKKTIENLEAKFTEKTEKNPLNEEPPTQTFINQGLLPYPSENA